MVIGGRETDRVGGGIQDPFLYPYLSLVSIKTTYNLGSS